MSRNCIKCGAEIGDLEVFCPKCGTVQNGQGANAGPNVTSTPMVKETQGTKKSTKKYIMIGALVAVVMLAGGLLIRSCGSSGGKDVKAETAQETTKTAKETSGTSQAQSAVPTNSAAAKAEQELWQKGVQGTVLASSIGHSGNGYISLMKNTNNQYQIITYDTKNGRIGITLYDRNLLYFTEKKPQKSGNEHVIFNMTILHDSADRDSGAGAWENGNHNLPIFANYKFDGAGNLVPGMLTTGKGTKPSHYQGYFNEQRNVDIINLFLTEMMALQKNIADNKVVLP